MLLNLSACCEASPEADISALCKFIYLQHWNNAMRLKETKDAANIFRLLIRF